MKSCDYIMYITKYVKGLFGYVLFGLIEFLSWKGLDLIYLT
jgi:hypothetical protein